MVELEGHLRQVGGVVILAVVGVADLAADHHEADLLLRAGGVHLRAVEVADDLAVAQNGEVGALLQDLVHVVGDEDDALAVVLELVDELIEELAALQGEGGGGLVHDEDLRLVGHAAHDLDELAVLKAVFVDAVGGLDMAQAEAVQKLLRGLVDLAHVEKAVCHGKFVEAPGEDIFRHGAVGDGVGLLEHHADAVQLGVHHAGGVPGLTLIEHFAAGRLLHTGDNGCDGGFAAAVLTDETADLTAVEADIHITERPGRSEILDHVPDLDDRFLLHTRPPLRMVSCAWGYA